MYSIQEYKDIIQKELEKYFNEIDMKYAKNVVESMKYTTLLDGKRLRGIFVLETCRMFCGDYKKALPVACAIEMLHAMSLIHDDLPCMDNDDLRRGKPSNHKVFGEALALLAGDALISFGAQMIINKTKDVDKEIVLDIVEQYLKKAGIYGIVGGQCADIEAENKKEEVSDEHLNFIHKYKTSALFEFSISSGAKLGGASVEEQTLMQEFAVAFGLNFQIYDDILDVISSTDELGKTAGKDEASSKTTYVSKYGLDNAKKKFNELILKKHDILKKIDVKSSAFIDIIEKLQKRIDK